MVDTLLKNLLYMRILCTTVVFNIISFLYIKVKLFAKQDVCVSYIRTKAPKDITGLQVFAYLVVITFRVHHPCFSFRQNQILIIYNIMVNRVTESKF